MRHPIPLLACACLLGLQTLAFAQTPAPLAEPGVSADDCRVAPEGGAAQDAAPPPAGTDLTAKLDKCNGVLQPPPTGDTEIRETPPAGGETPVIPPGALPEQQPPADGSPPAAPPAGGTASPA